MDLNSNSADSEKTSNVRTIKEIALTKYQQIQCSVHDRCRQTLTLKLFVEENKRVMIKET